MSDRSSVQITLYGVAGHEQEVAELFGEFEVDWCDELTAGAVVDGVTVTNQEYPLGCLGEFGPPLEEMGVSYYGEQGSRYEWAAEVRMFTPDLGVFRSDSNGEGLPLVSSNMVNAIVAECASDLPLMRYRLLTLTGKAHTERFAELQAAVTP